MFGFGRWTVAVHDLGPGPKTVRIVLSQRLCREERSALLSGEEPRPSSTEPRHLQSKEQLPSGDGRQEALAQIANSACEDRGVAGTGT